MKLKKNSIYIGLKVCISFIISVSNFKNFVTLKKHTALLDLARG